jgi:cytochrome c peroxidase
MMRRLSAVLAIAGAAVVAAVLALGPSAGSAWTDDQKRLLRSLSLDALPPPPDDPSNRYDTDPRAAVLGKRFFADKRFSRDGSVSCASCHMPRRGFQDGKPLAEAIGRTRRRTMPLAGVSHLTWLFWDGRKDSLWSQTLEPLESRVEHGGTRMQYARVIARHYRREYEAVFGPLPRVLGRRAVSRVFANLGKAIAAFERTLRPARTRFDRYVAGEDVLGDRELRGLRLFIGRAHCVDCHSGPLFTNGEFHNTGVPPNPSVGADRGRAEAIRKLLADEFNCLGVYSDAAPSQCPERFLVRSGARLRGAFKPPSLRGVARRPPYMHAGQLRTLDDVLEHYNRAPRAVVGRSELHPLGLGRGDLAALKAFLSSLSP